MQDPSPAAACYCGAAAAAQNMQGNNVATLQLVYGSKGSQRFMNVALWAAHAVGLQAVSHPQYMQQAAR